VRLPRTLRAGRRWWYRSERPAGNVTPVSGSVEPVVGFAAEPGGGRIAYGVAGAGPPLVLLPGWLSHVTELWTHPEAASALAKLSSDHRVVWYDRLGSGLSDRDRGSTSSRIDVDQLVAVLDALEVERCDLVGYSSGGPPAITFAIDHPERVRHLVLCSTYARGADLVDAEMFDALIALVRSGWELASATMAAVFIPDGSRADVRWFSRFQRLASAPDAAAELMTYIRHQDVLGRLADVGVPTTVVGSTEDRVVSIDRARELARSIPGARLVQVAGRTHDPFIRDTGDVVEAILSAVEGRSRLVSATADTPVPATPLTPRETEVLQALAEGSPNKAIAARLGVSEATVERHLTNVYRKLGASGRADAAVRGVTSGLVRIPS
jgi:pimeloyl-ACP methyl ester carboxylesterase/DNA-binding CsgD family transcriptional regulator